MVVSFQRSGANILIVKPATKMGESKMCRKSDDGFMMLELLFGLACVVRLVLCSVFFVAGL
jgi:hypothetical protein